MVAPTYQDVHTMEHKTEKKRKKEIEKMRKKNKVIIRELSSFEKKWLRLFAADISKKDFDEHINHGGYIWHVFSWKMKPEESFLTGDKAREAFDNAQKEGAVYYEPWPQNGPHNPKYDSPSSSDLDELVECYVIASDKSWTYIKTHEDGFFGPYFYKKQ